MEKDKTNGVREYKYALRSIMGHELVPCCAEMDGSKHWSGADHLIEMDRSSLKQDR